MSCRRNGLRKQVIAKESLEFKREREMHFSRQKREESFRHALERRERGNPEERMGWGKAQCAP